MDVSQSKWLQGMEGFIKEDNAKWRKDTILQTLVLLVLGGIGLGIYFFADMSWGIVLGGILLLSAVLFFLLNFWKGNGALKSLEKMISDKCNTSEKLAQFDKEFMEQPKALVDTKTQRYVFTENYMMLQFKRAANMSQNKLIYLPEIAKMEAVSYTSGSNVSYSCFFYHNNEKRHFLRLDFKKKKVGREFAEKISMVRPGILQ